MADLHYQFHRATGPPGREEDYHARRSGQVCRNSITCKRLEGPGTREGARARKVTDAATLPGVRCPHKRKESFCAGRDSAAGRVRLLQATDHPAAVAVQDP